MMYEEDSQQWKIWTHRFVEYIYIFISTWYFKDESEWKIGNYEKDLLRYVLGILHPTFVGRGRVIRMETEGDITPDFLQAKILSVTIQTNM